MLCTGRGLYRGVAGVAALVLLAVLPVDVAAAWLGFRNDTDMPIVVQGASIVDGKLRRGKPNLLYPGEVSWDVIVVPGKKLLLIQEYKDPKRILFQDSILLVGQDMFLSIQVEPPPKNAAKAPPKAVAPKAVAPKAVAPKTLPKATPLPAPKLRLTPTKPPSPPPGILPPGM